MCLILTELQELWKDATEYWINHNLNGIPIEKFIYANDRYNDNRSDRPVKRLICEEEHISIFIDDREKYVLEVSSIGEL